MADGKQGAQEAWRAYLELALGVTEASRKKAQKVAKRLAGRGGATAQQLQALADNLVSTSLANREALTKLVRFEVDRALGAVGLATAEEVADLQGRVRDLERQLAGGQAPGGAVAAAAAATAGAPATRAVAKKAVAKKAVAKKAVKKTAVTKAAPVTAVGKKAVAKKAVPSKAVASKAVASKAVAKQAPAKSAVAKKVAPPAGMAPE